MMAFQLPVPLRVVWHHPYLFDAILLTDRTNYVVLKLIFFVGE